MNILITYFSAEGTTAAIAKRVAQHNELDLFEIRPEVPYTKGDIRWMNPLARCNKEKFSKADVPVVGKIENFDSYDTICIGFPIWYGCAPNVVNTFCKGYNWTGKRVIAFATSGGSPIGKTADKLAPYVPGAASVRAVLVKDADELNALLK